MDELFGASQSPDDEQQAAQPQEEQQPHSQSQSHQQQQQQPQSQEQQQQEQMGADDGDQLLRQIIDTLIDEDVRFLNDKLT